jgi:large subunit ribosomal protein L10
LDKVTKEKEITQLKERLSRTKAAYVTSFRGMPVSEITEMRSRLREQDVEYKVIKNRLFFIASKGTDYEGVNEIVDGPTGIAFIYGDPVGAAKVLVESLHSDSPLLIRGGYIGKDKVDEAQIKILSKLPSREVLLAKLIGSAVSPVQRWVNVLSAVPREFVQVLAALKTKKSEGGEGETKGS